MFADIILSLVFAGILSASLMHMPLFCKRLVRVCPDWLFAATIHFGYGSWIGGVTGHMLGAMLSIPMYFIKRYYLNALFEKELDQAWQQSFIYRAFWCRVEQGWQKFQDWGRDTFVPASWQAEVASA